jgi:DNA-binding transcriptional LysR family regulator
LIVTLSCMDPVESRRLRYFVAVAEELSFARAAERLHIAPPALSRAVSELETQLGVKLFVRSSRRVALTDTGSALLPDVRRALQALDGATNRVRRSRDSQRHVVVAYKSDMDGGLLEQVGALLATEEDPISLQALLGGWQEQPAQLRDGLADVALLYEPFDQRELTFRLLVEEPRLVALPTTSPLAEAKVVSLNELEGDFAPTPGPYVWQVRAPLGLATLPRIRDISQLLRLVELGEIIAMLPMSVAVRFMRASIRYRQVAELPPARLFVAWPTGSETGDVSRFVRAAASVISAEPTTRDTLARRTAFDREPGFE